MQSKEDAGTHEKSQAADDTKIVSRVETVLQEGQICVFIISSAAGILETESTEQEGSRRWSLEAVMNWCPNREED